MSSINNHFLRGKCENCGAPIKRSHTKGKYICQYCGSEYYSDNFNEVNWVSDEENVNPNLPGSYLGDDFSQTNTNRQSQKFLIPIIGIIALIFVIFIFGILNNLTGKASITSKNNSRISPTPPMLSSLPNAVKAGNSVAYKGWEVVVDPNLEMNNKLISISFSIQNWSDGNQVLRYQVKNFILYDDLGNTYPVHLGSCDIDTPYLDRQLSFDSYEKITMKSSNSWCNRNSSIPFFSGIIPAGAKNLYFYFEHFGVYEKITFVINI